MNGVVYRKASLSDVFPIMKLYQMACDSPRDAVLLDKRKLTLSLADDSTLWVVGEKDGGLLVYVSILIDRENRIAKINRLAIEPEWRESEGIVKSALPLLLEYLKPKADVIYTTTRTMSLRQQELTLGMGFQVLGVFPNATGADPLKINGLTAYFYPDVLGARRDARFKLHPVLAPFYEIVRRQCGLPKLAVPETFAKLEVSPEALPSLELIHAPHFVAHRFAKLTERQSLSMHFYPFQEPNVLITDPDQRIEIFVRMERETRFAAIIGERLDRAVDPVALYDAVSCLLNENGVTYVEAINDAGDLDAVQAILDAGYLPCAYFPCLKPSGGKRRDYVVLARSFERLFWKEPAPPDVSPLYLDFLTEYYRLEEESYLSRFKRPSTVSPQKV